MQFDIHLLNTYYMLNTDSPKMDRAVPPENRYPKMAHRLGSRGSWTDKGTPAQRRVVEGGWVEEYGKTASVNSLLLLSTMNLLCWGGKMEHSQKTWELFSPRNGQCLIQSQMVKAQQDRC